MPNFLRVGVVVFIFFSLSFVSIAQQSASFSPQQGPIGTTVFINCGGNSTVALFAGQQIALDANGFASFDVPTAYAPGNYPIACQTGANNRTLGNFRVTQCPLLNERTLSANQVQSLSSISGQSNGLIPNLTGENISVAGQNNYRYIVDIANNDGSQIRLIVQSNDPTRLVNYINSMSFAFQVYGEARAVEMATCGVDVQLPFGTNQINTQNDSVIDVELVLLSGGSVQADENYLVYFVTSAPIEPLVSHSYQPENASAIASKLSNYQGFFNLSSWDEDNFAQYNDTVDTFNPNIGIPALVARTVRQADYTIRVNNTVSNVGNYTLVGTFETTSCNTFNDTCLGNRVVQSVVLARGVGITSGNPVYNGNFEVEAYCPQILPNSSVSHDDVNWYCGSGSIQLQLTEEDFTQICRQTYSNPQAFAVRDLDLTTPDNSQNNIPAFNWRCLGPASR